MTGKRLKKLGAALAASVLAAACDGPTRPTPTPAVSNLPPPPAFNPGPALEALAGSYTLTLTISDHCTEIPDAARLRTYQAALQSTPFRYLSIRVVGGGFSQPTGTGDVWPYGEGRVQISWNNFDIGGCDGWPEPLAGGSSLMVCGEGLAVTDASTISGAIVGQVWIDEDGTRRGLCNASHPFTFTRLTPPPASR
jgi:hypothetical protein